MKRALKILLPWYIPFLAVLLLTVEWLRVTDLWHPRLTAFRSNLTNFMLSKSGQLTLFAGFGLWFLLLIWIRAQFGYNTSKSGLCSRIDGRSLSKAALLFLAFYGYVTVWDGLPQFGDARSFLLGIDQSTNMLVLVTGIFLTEIVRTVRKWINESEPFCPENSLLLLALTFAATALVQTEAPLVFKYRDQVRWTGLWVNPNTYGLVMGVGVVLALGLVSSFSAPSFSKTKIALSNRFMSALYVVAAVLSGVGVLYSYSRGAWLAAAVAAAYLGYGCVRIAGLVKSRTLPGSDSFVSRVAQWTFRNWILLAVLMVSGAILLLGQLRASEWHPARRILSIGNSHDFSWRNRVSAWEGALQIMSDRPWSGFGWGRPESVYDQFYRSVRLEESMAIQLNDFLTLGSTLGIPALLCFAAYVWLSFVRRSKGAGGMESGLAESRASDLPAAEILQWTCRAGAVVLLIGFWFDGGLFKLVTASLFWILTELGSTVPDKHNYRLRGVVVDAPQEQVVSRSSGKFVQWAMQQFKTGRKWLIIGGIALCGGLGATVYSILSRDPALADPAYQQLLSTVVSSEAMPVSISPNGEYLLLKRENTDGFQLEVVERKTGSVVTSSHSRNSQTSLTWRPDSRVIVFQEYAGNERPIRILDIASGETSQPKIPVSQTALPPLRWAPDGVRLAYFSGTWNRGDLVVFDSANGSVQILQRDAPLITDFAWSPDGQRIATATGEPSGEIIVLGSKEAPVSVGIAEGAEIRHLAWSPDGRFILAVARAGDDSYARLWEVDMTTRKSALIVQGNGDVSRPLWAGNSDAFLYQVNSNGILSTIFGTRTTPVIRTLEPSQGTLRITGFDPTGTTAFAHCTALASPPTLWELSLKATNAALVYPKAIDTNFVSPDFISIPTSADMMVPAFHWKSKTGNPSAVLILVHGGVHSQALPNWDPAIQHLVKQNCDVVSINYRGSSGYGQAFERADQGFNSVMDVVAARNYAVETLQIPAHRVYLMGMSKGAPLAASAATHGEKIGGLILVSWAGQGHNFGQLSHAFPISLFHGTDDPVVPQKKARKAVEQLFASTSAVDLEPTWHLFENEGHHYNRGASWARVYWEVLAFMSRE